MKLEVWRKNEGKTKTFKFKFEVPEFECSLRNFREIEEFFGRIKNNPGENYACIQVSSD